MSATLCILGVMCWALGMLAMISYADNGVKSAERFVTPLLLAGVVFLGAGLLTWSAP